jgi:hypothetical protein
MGTRADELANENPFKPEHNPDIDPAGYDVEANQGKPFGWNEIGSGGDSDEPKGP